MKIIKKIIILLFMIMGILTLGMSTVHAQTHFNDSETENKRVIGDELDFDGNYNLNWDDSHNYLNVHCAQPGNYIYGRGKTKPYKLISHVRITGKNAVRVNKKGNEIAASEVGPYKCNLKMATAIGSGCLSDSEIGYFIWGYMKTWLEEDKHALCKEDPDEYYKNLKGFSIKNVTKKKNPNYSEINDKVNDAMEKLGSTEKNDNFKVVTSSAVRKDIKIGNVDYIRFGPYTIKNMPSSGLKKFDIKDQNGDVIKRC